MTGRGEDPGKKGGTNIYADWFTHPILERNLPVFFQTMKGGRTCVREKGFPVGRKKTGFPWVVLGIVLCGDNGK